MRRIYTHFDSIIDAYRAAGLAATGRGHPVDQAALLLDWAAVTRKLGRPPSENQYARHGRHSCAPFLARWRHWSAMPQTFRQWAEKGDEIRSKWADVLALVAKFPRNPRDRRSPKGPPPPPPPAIKLARRNRPEFHRGRTIYAPVLAVPGLAHEPTDENGVILLFGILAQRLGFTVLRTQSAFPDCEALREIRPGRYQRVTIEFEFLSRNFFKHGHSARDCDLIVCWRHNWPQCPAGLEVLELSQVVRKM